MGMALQAQAVHRLGDQEQAQRIFERLESFEKYNVILGTSAVYYGPVPRYLGLLSDTLGRYAEAEDLLQIARVELGQRSVSGQCYSAMPNRAWMN